jgi:uncharacterized repeat protein (TIGR01451 family)
VGRELTFTATVVNRGPQAASRVSLGETLPASVTLLRVTTSQGQCSGAGTVVCALGNLAPGASATVAVTVRPTIRGTLSTSASVTATESDPERGNNTASQSTVVRR